MEKKTLKQKTVVGQVMEEIKSLIATGQFKVNDQIPSENELADMFGVSRPTIREAIKIFNYLGVLTSHSGRGTFVSDSSNISAEALTWSILLNQKSMVDLVELREIIEHRSVIRMTRDLQANMKDSQEQVAEIEVQVNIMAKAIMDGEKNVLNQADFEFHQLVILGSRNSLFYDIYHTLSSFISMEIAKTHAELEDLNYIYHEHKKILEGIKSGDPHLAISALNSHFTSYCWQKIKKGTYLDDFYVNYSD